MPSYTCLSIDNYSIKWAEQNSKRVAELEELVRDLGKEDEEVKQKSKKMANEVISGYHSSISMGIRQGIDYILDHVLWWPSIVDNCITALAPFDILFVGVYCPLEILKQREIARGDRAEGIAEIQFPHVHKGKKYDIEIHTDKNNPYECAAIIADFMKTRESCIPFSEKFF